MSKAMTLYEVLKTIADECDLESVVRCKYCKHGLKVVSPITAIFCTRFGAKDMAVEDDDYCSYGERGEQDDSF